MTVFENAVNPNMTLDVKGFKNRHGLESEFRLRFDPEKGLFLPLPTGVEMEQEQIEKISKIITDNPKVNVAQIQNEIQLPEKKLRKLLKRGEGTFWRVEAGPHNKHQYIGIDNE